MAHPYVLGRWLRQPLALDEACISSLRGRNHAKYGLLWQAACQRRTLLGAPPHYPNPAQVAHSPNLTWYIPIYLGSLSTSRADDPPHFRLQVAVRGMQASVLLHGDCAVPRSSVTATSSRSRQVSRRSMARLTRFVFACMMLSAC